MASLLNLQQLLDMLMALLKAEIGIKSLNAFVNATEVSLNMSSHYLPRCATIISRQTVIGEVPEGNRRDYNKSG
jgi:hypothetical protein